METKNTEKETMEDVNEMMNKIMVQCPVHKVNFQFECPQTIAGMYLLTMPKAEDILHDMVDLDKVTNSTALFFAPRHIGETAQLVYGMLVILEQNKWISKQDVYFMIDSILEMPSPCRYEKFKSFLQDNVLDKMTKVPENILKNVEYIIMNIWFVPYGKVDDIARVGIKEFNSHKGDNNE